MSITVLIVCVFIVKHTAYFLSILYGYFRYVSIISSIYTRLIIRVSKTI